MDIFRTLDQNYLRFNGSRIHVIFDTNKQLWFNISEAARALRIKVPDRIYKDPMLKDYIRPQSKITVDHIYGQARMRYIEEPGLYIMVTKSKTALGARFRKWLFRRVIPAVARYRTYRLTKAHEMEIDNLTDKINTLSIEATNLKEHLKKHKYPNGGLVYVVLYRDHNGPYYRIGMTTNMKLRKKIYDTHTLFNRPVVFFMEHMCPKRLEMCVQFILYDYVYIEGKSYYDCSLTRIKNVFKECIRDIKTCEIQAKKAVQARKRASQTKQRGGSKCSAHRGVPQRRVIDPMRCVIIKERQRRNYLRMKVKRLNEYLFG